MRKNLFLITLLLFIKVCGAQIKYKMLVETGPSFGQYMLTIIPLTYDTTVSDQKILTWSDSLETGLFNNLEYHLLYKGDSTKVAVQVNEAVYYFVHTRFTITKYWKNGNKRSITYFNKAFTKYWTINFHTDATPESKGKYRRDKKCGKWIYYNEKGYKIKKEVYAKDGTLKKTKDYPTPKHTFTTMFNPKHPRGVPYIIQ